MSIIFKSRSLLSIALSVTLTAFATGVHAQSVQDEKPMALRAVMKQLGDDMQAVTGAISHEDWALVAGLASKIANHAEPPPEERVKIITWLGADASKFRGTDLKMKEAATEMGEAAKQADGPGVIAAFSKTQQNCLACHQIFRQSFIKQFYDNR
ncbi:cytochrome c [Advenella sp. RU8]|uniref:cytochrome c n=1 Tax=Advenella sp. RU8 TaxID=3399575 RepID=UPI003AAD0F9D